MGFSIRNILKTKTAEAEQQKTTAIEITDQQIRDAAGETFLRELAFQRCTSIVSNLLGKCEIRTFANGKEVFKEEYYLWNFEPNKNQNKQQFIDQVIEKMFSKNEALIIESYDGQLFVADDYEKKDNPIEGNIYRNVRVGDYEFKREFKSADVILLKPNFKDVNKVLKNVYSSYAKLIDYAAESFLKTRGSRGILEISALAQSKKDFADTLKKMLNEYFRTFFESANAVLPLFDGYKYTDLGSKTYNETTSRDIKAQYDDVFEFYARAFGISPSVAKGDVQDNSKAMDETLTTCLEPLAKSIQTEINRKRNGKAAVLSGTYCMIDTKYVKHIDMFDISTQVDKLVASGICTINMILRAIGEPRIEEGWADRHMMTKNYASIEEILKSIGMKGGEQSE